MLYRFFGMSKKALIAIVSQISIIIIVFCSLLIIPSAIKNQKENKYKLLNSHMIIEDFSNRIDTIEEFNEYTKNNQRYINAITGKTISDIYPFFISTIYIDSTMYKYRSGYQIIVTDDFDQLCSIYKNGYSEKTEINSEPGVYVSSSLYFLNNCSSLNGYGDFDDKTPSYYLNVSGYYQEDKNDVNKGDKYIVMSFDYYLNNDISKYLECSYSGCVYKCNEEVLYSDISKINTNDILDLMCKDSLIYEELESYQPIFNVSRILLFLSIMIISINCIIIIWQNNVLEKENNYILYVYYQKPISILKKSLIHSFLIVTLSFFISLVIVSIIQLIIKSMVGVSGSVSINTIYILLFAFMITFISEFSTKLLFRKKYRKI